MEEGSEHHGPPSVYLGHDAGGSNEMVHKRPMRSTIFPAEQVNRELVSVTNSSKIVRRPLHLAELLIQLPVRLRDG
jgi:hypothetical protein